MPENANQDASSMFATARQWMEWLSQPSEHSQPRKKIPDVHHSKDFHYNISFKDTNLCTSMSKDALVDLLVALRGYVLDCLLVGFYWQAFSLQGLAVYSDLTIRCGDTTFDVHKAVISTRYKFFETVCSGGVVCSVFVYQVRLMPSPGAFR